MFTKEEQEAMMKEAQARVAAQYGVTFDEETPPPPKEGETVPPPGDGEVKKTGEELANILKGKIKNYLGDEEEVEFDLSDEAKKLELLQKARNASLYEEDYKALEDEYKAIILKNKEMQEKLKQTSKSYEELEKEILAKHKEKLLKEIEEESSLTEEEKKAREKQKEETETQRLIKKMQEELDEYKKQDSKKEVERQHSAFAQVVNNARKAHMLQGQSKLEQLGNQAIFDRAKADLKAKQEQGVILTQAVVNRAFRTAYVIEKAEVEKQRESIKEEAVKSQINSTMKAAQTQKASTQGSSGSESGTDTVARWRKMINEGKDYEVMKEIGTDSDKAQLFIKNFGK